MKEKTFYEQVRYLWYVCIHGTHKNSHLLFFTRNIIRYISPKWFTQSRLKAKLNAFNKLSSSEQAYVLQRVNYYCKFADHIYLPVDAPFLRHFTYRKKESYVHDYVNSTYFFDAYEYIRFFPSHLRWAYNPGDVNYLFPIPEITKSRPLKPEDGNRNNILLNLDKVRHFTWITDPFKWEEKECRILFRGDITNKPHRQRFIDMWKDHPLCDITCAGGMSLYDHLYCRYIMSLEGNDVASNLKWVMSSNSVAVMPRPTCETWYMEGQLIPNYHYIEIAADYHDLIDRINYYEAHPEEAKAIVAHAHEWVCQFRDKKREDLISLMVLDKYFRLSGQYTDHQQPNRYIVNEIVKLSNQQRLNAQGKAREDVLHTALDLGYHIHDIINHKYVCKKGERPHHYPFFSHWLANWQGKKFVQQIKAGDTVIMQEFYLDYMQNISTECLRRQAKVIFLVHDIQCIRFNKQTSEIRKLNNASLLLVHTEAMKEKLTALGVTTPMRVMQLFDYYTADPMMTVEETMRHKQEVVFAGNLSKSIFLRGIKADNSNKHLRFILYGILGDLNLDDAANMKYHGIFRPDKTSSICGGWGLIWDGDSIGSCTGDYGNYLRYNASHKTSLYLACGLPVIVWEHSSLAEWVTKENIGIVVSSLRHLEEAINQISDDDYRQMVVNAKQTGNKLREGCFLKQALKNS